MHSGDLSQSPARSINRRRELKSEYAEHQAFLFKSPYLYAIRANCGKINFADFARLRWFANRGSRWPESRGSVSISATEGKRKRQRKKKSRKRVSGLESDLKRKIGSSRRPASIRDSRREPSRRSGLSCVKTVGFGQSRSIRERGRSAAAEAAEARRRRPRRADDGRGAADAAEARLGSDA